LKHKIRIQQKKFSLIRIYFYRPKRTGNYFFKGKSNNRQLQIVGEFDLLPWLRLNYRPLDHLAVVRA